MVIPSISEYDGIVFFGSLDSHIYGIDINTGRQTWKFPTMNIIDSSAAIASSMIFIGSGMVCFIVFWFKKQTSLYRLPKIYDAIQS